ncbi:ras GTPase-activating-like protein IQGAP1 [Dinothrombium tinctorium]|uniref:Ras GTPase-activating-like protein IQGAP1 n=1 Tax=Dinothrombium tinctorium TaxID=1965070 RepID=A0A3S3PKL6_9ACAR|nr:ras GTPase-activating-like protein IQGAP1 [Dinothrombium tinctorium]
MKSSTIEQLKERVVSEVKEKLILEALRGVEKAIAKGSSIDLLNAIRNPIFGFTVNEEARGVYFFEVCDFRRLVNRSLNFNEIRNILKLVDGVVAINVAIKQDSTQLVQLLLSPTVYLQNVYKRKMPFYRLALSDNLKMKGEFLIHDELQSIILEVNENTIYDFITPFQAAIRGFLVRRKFKILQTNKATRNEAQMESLEDLVVKLRNWQHGSPPLSLVRRVLHLTDINEDDYALEVELQKITEEVVKYVRINRDLQEKIDCFDLRIGSLVRNSKITFAETESLKADLQIKPSDCRGINDFSKEGRLKLEAYQHLFYALQTNPKYLTHLFTLSSAKFSSLLKSSIFTLFGYEASERESYFLLNLLASVLKEEIKNKLNSPEDIIKSPPFVLNFAIDYYRASYRKQLSETFEPLIRNVLNVKRKLIMDPVQLYKAWINEKETEQGEKCELPYDVTAEEALKYDEVKRRLDETFEIVVRLTTDIVDVITCDEFITVLPYGISYLCKVIFNCLKKRFKISSERELFKILGNIFWYRFLSPLVITPDVYGVFATTIHDKISLEGRSNLATISKILQAAIFGKKWHNSIKLDSNDFLQGCRISLFLRESFEKFQNFFHFLCLIAEPSELYGINQFSDAALLVPPMITLKVSEIYEFHHWIYDHKDKLAPKEDILHELLEDCGPPPARIQDLFNFDVSEKRKGNSIDDRISTIEITLTLSSKRDVVIDQNEIVSKTTVLLKQAIVELIVHRSSCDDLNEVFFRKLKPEEENEYRLSRELRLKKVPLELRKNSVIFSSNGQSLEGLLEFVKFNLKSMNVAKFDDILMQIVQDVFRRVKYRQKRHFMLQNLRKTSIALQEKRDQMQDTLRCYQQYVNKCLENFGRCLDNRKVASKSSIVSLKYTAAKLIQKGVLVALKDVEASQLKRIYFEISSFENNSGIFTVRATYRGLEIERMQLDFQNLLHLQYEGISVFNLSGKAKTMFFAQKSANILSKKCAFAVSKESPFGENIAGGNLSCVDVVDRWYRQKRKFNEKDAENSRAAGQYTQMIWKGSKYLGCGVATHCKFRFVIVCYYFPPGNIKDEYKDNV